MSLTVNFSVANVSGTGGVPATFQFTDTTTGIGSYLRVYWLWDFGDGFSSGERNPRHTYRTVGFFTVRLTINIEGEESYWDPIQEVYTAGAYKEVVAQISTSANSSVALQDQCLRLATEPSEGYGWSECNGASWVNPIDNGCMQLFDEFRSPRSLVFDEDGFIYEVDSVDTLSSDYIFPLDKNSAEISWEHHGDEETPFGGVGGGLLQHDISHISIEPKYPELRGETGYTPEGLRNATTLDMEIYVEGEKVTPELITEDIPDDGDISFGGVSDDFKKIQMVTKGIGAELRITGIDHRFLAKDKCGTREERTGSEDAAQATLAGGRAVYCFNSPINRVNNLQSDGASNVSVDGPDGVAGSGFYPISQMTITRPEVTGYTIMMWTATATPGPIAGVTMAQYSSDVVIGATTWKLLYVASSGVLAANTVIPANARVFDLRVYNKVITNLSAILPAYYRAITQRAGKGYVPTR